MQSWGGIGRCNRLPEYHHRLMSEAIHFRLQFANLVITGFDKYIMIATLFSCYFTSSYRGMLKRTESADVPRTGFWL